MIVDLQLTVDGELRAVAVDTRTTLLDALRDGMEVTAPKKGCDHGQCGTCTTYDATGTRVRTLPLTPDRFLG